MPSPPLRLLFSRLKVGHITLRNRFVFLPHSNNFAIGELPSDRERFYFAERAKGGVGLIIYGSQPVDGQRGAMRTNLKHQGIVPRYQLLSDEVHKHGCYIVAQLIHEGHSAKHSETGLEWRAPMSASTQPRGKVVAGEMGREDIQRAIDDYCRGAGKVKAGGMDGVEIRGRSLPGDFLSSAYNHRQDEYGGSLDNRLRFYLELIKAVRTEVGPNLIVGVRLTLDEMAKPGYDLEEGVEIARRVVATGQIDYVNTAIGPNDEFSAHIQGPMPLPRGYAVDASRAVKEAVKVPVIAHGGINDPFQAEQILAAGQGDLIGMARGLIADPEFPNKAHEGRLKDIRKCPGYHEVCQGRNEKYLPITCVQNPSAGREQTLGMGTLKPAAVTKQVMVVGGGPAGLKVAEVAARRGHQVTLYEKEKELGGQINLAQKPPFRESVGEISQHLIN